MIAKMQYQLDTSVEILNEQSTTITTLENENLELKNKIAKWTASSVYVTTVLDQVESDKIRKKSAGFGYAPPMCGNYSTIPDLKLHKLKNPEWKEPETSIVEEIFKNQDVKIGGSKPYVSSGFINQTVDTKDTLKSDLNPHVSEYIPLEKTKVFEQPILQSLKIETPKSIPIKISSPPSSTISSEPCTTCQDFSSSTPTSSNSDSKTHSPKLVLCTFCKKRTHVYVDCPLRKRPKVVPPKQHAKLETPQFYQSKTHNKPSRERVYQGVDHINRRQGPGDVGVGFVNKYTYDKRHFSNNSQRPRKKALKCHDKPKKGPQQFVSSPVKTRLSKGQRSRRNRRLRKLLEMNQSNAKAINEIDSVSEGGVKIILKKIRFMDVHGQTKSVMAWIPKVN